MKSALERPIIEEKRVNFEQKQEVERRIEEEKWEEEYNEKGPYVYEKYEAVQLSQFIVELYGERVI